MSSELWNPRFKQWTRFKVCRQRHQEALTTTKCPVPTKISISGMLKQILLLKPLTLSGGFSDITVKSECPSFPFCIGGQQRWLLLPGLSAVHSLMGTNGILGLPSRHTGAGRDKVQPWGGCFTGHQYSPNFTLDSLGFWKNP